MFRKVISCQLVVYSRFEFSEAVTKFAPSIYSVYLPENENFVKLEDISKGKNKKIDQTWKRYKLEKRYNRNGDAYISFCQNCQ